MPATQTKIDDFCWTVKTVHTSDGGKSRAAAVESSHKRPSLHHLKESGDIGPKNIKGNFLLLLGSIKDL